MWVHVLRVYACDVGSRGFAATRACNLCGGQRQRPVRENITAGSRMKPGKREKERKHAHTMRRKQKKEQNILDTVSCTFTSFATASLNCGPWLLRNDRALRWNNSPLTRRLADGAAVLISSMRRRGHPFNCSSSKPRRIEINRLLLVIGAPKKSDSQLYWSFQHFDYVSPFSAFCARLRFFFLSAKVPQDTCAMHKKHIYRSRRLKDQICIIRIYVRCMHLCNESWHIFH